MQPGNVIEALTHDYPYLYYASLEGFAYDHGLRAWVASSPAAMREVLSNPACRVRPAAEPVPRAIAGTSAGDIFRQLMRMNDGEGHDAPKQALQRKLAEVDLPALMVSARRIGEAERGLSLDAWTHRVPVRAVAMQLGFADAQLPELTAQFVACLSPLSTPAQLEAASTAARALLAAFDGEANLVGLLSQTYEATAGLIGNTIVALCRQPDLRALPMLQVVREVSRIDPSIHLTRRFLAEPTIIAGTAVAAGDTIIVVLANAGLGFGHGSHACPGQELACHTAAGAIEALLADPHFSTAGLRWRYRPSVNARIPLFDKESA